MSPITQTPIPLSDEWATPAEIFDPLEEEFGFMLDAAAQPWNRKCLRFLSYDGLDIPWIPGPVWLNPPYSEIGRWMEKAHRESLEHSVTVVCLVPCTPDRHWWADHVEGKAEVRLLTRKNLRSGRVHFERSDGSSGRAPFASAVVIYRAALPRAATEK
jgi:phage N-6-adenine-methyltransferase